MMVNLLRLEAAKRTVDRVLAEEITPERDPAAFADDAIYIDIAIVEQNDVAWLLDRLADTGVALTAKELVVQQMSTDAHEQARQLLEEQRAASGISE
jgi:hypothetical protein